MTPETVQPGAAPAQNIHGSGRVLPVPDQIASTPSDEASPYAWLALLAGVAAFAVPSYELRPNRIASGEDAWLWQTPILAAPLALALVLILTW